MQSINFPCVMIESKKDTHYTIADLTRFAIIRDNEDLTKFGKLFIDPVITHYHTIVREALRIERHFKL